MKLRSRAFLFFSLVLLAFTLPVTADAARHRQVKKVTRKAASVSAIGDPRYADLIMNPVTGEIYHQDDPDGRRYPASLTKMMTLYMLFEALEQHKTTMNAHLDISEYAASMPQTNLALTPGETIPVEIAIKALVVRSANDVAVVVGEALGGDVEHFAQMMTAKAHMLGMRNTVFKNPNGLPNSGQFTTARDMAKLGIALKRDFPRYYGYFNTRQFSWNGANYYTHNRVMLRYAGTDGIKTGFIGASGFNLVTSVTRGGRPLVGVVMGGITGGWRDNRMIQLLDATYKTIAERGAQRGRIYAENLPLSKNGARAGIRQEAVTASATLDAPTANENDVLPPDAPEEDTDTPALLPAKAQTVVKLNGKPTLVTAQVSAATLKKPVSAEPIRQTAPGNRSAPVLASAPIAPTPSPAVEDATVPPMNSPFTALNESVPAKVNKLAETGLRAAIPTKSESVPSPSAGGAAIAGTNAWGIQVGAFSSQELAERATSQARSLGKGALAQAQSGIAGPTVNGAPIYRARLVNLTQPQAKTACEALIAHNAPCFIFKTTP